MRAIENVAQNPEKACSPLELTIESEIQPDDNLDHRFSLLSSKRIACVNGDESR